MIPITIATNKGEIFSTVLEKKCQAVTLPANMDSWIKINWGTIGYYRTQYPPELLDRLLPAIRDKTLPPLDRLGLLDDLFALVGYTKKFNFDYFYVRNTY